MNPNQEQFLTRAEDSMQMTAKFQEFNASIVERYPLISGRPNKELTEEQRQMSDKEAIEHDLRQLVMRHHVIDQVLQVATHALKRNAVAIQSFAQLAGKPLDGTHIDLEDLTFSVRYDPEYNYAENDTEFRNGEWVAFSPSFKQLEVDLDKAKKETSRVTKLIADRKKEIEYWHKRMQDCRKGGPKYVVSIYYNKFDIEV